MKALIPYLFFNGNCREAMNFYQSCFGGKLEVMTYDDAPEGACSSEEFPQGSQDKVMHACLSNEEFSLMASDNPMGKAVVGDHIVLNIPCDNFSQQDKLFQALSTDGKIIQPLDDTFWGARFGMVIDKFGFQWMLNCLLEK